MLIIEGDEGVRLTVSALLTGAGFQVRSAADVLEGLAAAKESDLDVALVDLDLPRISGIQKLIARNRDLEQLVSTRPPVECGCLLHLNYASAKKLALSAFDTRYLQGLLLLADGNITHAATRAGLDRSNFRRLLKHNNLAPAREDPEREEA